MSQRTEKYAYYCSGHGYGHATRVSALASHLLQLSPKPYVTIISSAPAHVFSDSTRMGAKYRNAVIDPVIQQPLAYRVDRKKSLQVLQDFLKDRERLIEEEVAWLKKNDITCVLSDAVFIACAAANRAYLPSALITNFTFDSIWSYLTSQYIDKPSNEPSQLASLAPEPPNRIVLEPDEPLLHETMDPLADLIAQDLRNADLLLRLPGYLPFPSFSPANPLPSPDWVDLNTQRFYPSVVANLQAPIEQVPLYPSVPFPPGGPAKPFSRQMKEAPLLVRHPCPDVYSVEARRRILDKAGVPRELQDPERTKICIVSFGGQVIRKPSHSRGGSRNLSVSNTPLARPTEPTGLPTPPKESEGLLGPPALLEARTGIQANATPSNEVTINLNEPMGSRPHTPPEIKMEKLRSSLNELPRIATQTHIYIPGAPPASNPASPMSARRSNFLSIPGTIPHALGTPLAGTTEEDEVVDEDEAELLPDGWIAIVCGIAKNWGEEDLPEGFFVAPRDMWMPDLTAIGDVLLGKLGYGTCAECVDACTPFVYVPRPLIVEEHGLRRLMEESGVAVLLPQSEYELGNWASKVEEAYENGKAIKAEKRRNGWDDVRKREADNMARELNDWVKEWWEKLEPTSVMTVADSGDVKGRSSVLTGNRNEGRDGSPGHAGVGVTLTAVASSVGLAVEPISV